MKKSPSHRTGLKQHFTSKKSSPGSGSPTPMQRNKLPPKKIYRIDEKTSLQRPVTNFKSGNSSILEKIKRMKIGEKSINGP
jgi:hypothetical protein